MNLKVIPQLFVTAIVLFFVNSCVTHDQAASQNKSRIEIVELPQPVIPDGAKTVRWIAENDNSWKDGKPFFDIKDGTTAVADGWLAVTDTKILLKVIVYDDVHVNNNKGADIWGGDCLQIGIDARGDGTGKLDPKTRMVGGPDDGAFALALTKDGPEAWAYFLDKYNRSSLKDGAIKYQLRIDRNEGAKTTTYEVAFPWEEFSSSPAQTALFGLAVQVNDNNLKSDKQKRYYWGGGADGVPGPGLFNKLAIGNPPAAVFYAGAAATKLWNNYSCGEILLAAACDGELSAKCLAGEMQQVKPLGEFKLKNGVKRYAARWYPGKLPEGPVEMEASILDKDGNIMAQAKAGLVVPRQTIDKLHARIEELKASSPNDLFTQHLTSLDSIVQSEWGRAMCMPDNSAESVAEKAGDILNNLNGNAGEWNSYLQRRRGLVFARAAGQDNTLQFYRLVLPLNWNPDKTYPMIVFLHGHGSSNGINFISEISAKNYSGEKTGGIADDEQYFILAPWGRANSGYLEWSEDDIFQALADASGKFKIDKDRTYLTGHSMGGFGTWTVSINNPDRWAAICIVSGGIRKTTPADIGIARNIACLPVRIWHGGNDSTVKVDHAYTMQAALKKYGCEPEMVVVPGQGHAYPYSGYSENTRWLLEHSRKRPDKFSYIAYNDRCLGTWGINMKRDLKVSAIPSFDAIIEGNTVKIKSEGTTGLTVDCCPEGLGMNGSITIFWNGNKAYEGPAQKVKLGEGFP